MDRTTTGMDADYDDHSAYQRAVAATAADRLRRSVAAFEQASPGVAFTIVDYGASQGRNSAEMFRSIIEEYRRVHPSGLVVALHNDLPTNDWNSLITAATGPGGYGSTGTGTADSGDVLTMASASSFFDRCAPPSSVHVGMSFSAAHWLSSLPRLEAPDALYFDRCPAEARRALARQAALDWEQFLERRAEELHTDGHLLVQCVGSDLDSASGEELVTAGKAMALMSEVARSLVEDRLLSSEVFNSYVLPVVARTVDEAKAPLAGGALSDAFDVLECSIDAVPSPYEKQYAADADRDRYAADYAGFLRGFTATSFASGLFGPGHLGGDPEELAHEYYRRLTQKLRDQPGEHPFEDWTLTLWLRRR